MSPVGSPGSSSRERIETPPQGRMVRPRLGSPGSSSRERIETKGSRLAENTHSGSPGSSSRERIETSCQVRSSASAGGSPGSSSRERIETIVSPVKKICSCVLPAHRAGSGLKQRIHTAAVDLLAFSRLIEPGAD